MSHSLLSKGFEVEMYSGRPDGIPAADARAAAAAPLHAPDHPRTHLPPEKAIPP